MMNASRMAAIVLVFLLLAYPLSIGPVKRYYMGNSYIESRQMPYSLGEFYRPLLWSYEFEPFGRLMNAYEERWWPQWYMNQVLNPPMS
jgi:hypothetical protein